MIDKDFFYDGSFEELAQDDEYAKKLYDDYSEGLKKVYIKLYKRNPQDMTKRAHDLYAVLESVFQCSMPSNEPIFYIERDKAIELVEDLAKHFIKQDKYPATLAVVKYVRQKEISSMLADKQGLDDFFEVLPEQLRRIARHFEDELKKEQQRIRGEMLVQITDHTERLINLVGAGTYPWPHVYFQDENEESGC